jgi:hypothetical protein
MKILHATATGPENGVRTLARVRIKVAVWKWWSAR